MKRMFFFLSVKGFKINYIRLWFFNNLLLFLIHFQMIIKFICFVGRKKDRFVLI